MREGLGLVVLLWVQEDVGEGAFFQAPWPDDAAVRTLAEVLLEHVGVWWGLSSLDLTPIL